MKLAIIGTGISGLVAAYRLYADHEIVVFEANDYLGGHTNTVEVELDGEQHAVDTGFIVFNDWTYPNFISLLDELGIASRPTTMSFSVSDTRTGLEYNGHSLNTLFAQRRNLLRPSFHRMLADLVRFNRKARWLVTDCGHEITVGEFLSMHGYSRGFAEQYLLPMGAAIWSCPTGTFAQFPIRFIIDFYHNHGLLNFLHRPTCAHDRRRFLVLRQSDHSWLLRSNSTAYPGGTRVPVYRSRRSEAVWRRARVL